MKLTTDAISQPPHGHEGGADLVLDHDTGQGSRFKQELAPILVCIVFGLVMALLPALIQRLVLGSMIWIGNGDELFMLALGSQAYFNHPLYLSDPVLVSGGVSLFRQLPLLPGVWLAWLLGMGPLGIDVCWRILAGLSLGAAWYFLIRQFVARPWVATCLVLVLLADIGMLSAGLFFRQMQATTAMLRQSPNLIGGDFLHSEWRVATPALTMAFFLLNLWLGDVRPANAHATVALALGPELRAAVPRLPLFLDRRDRGTCPGLPDRSWASPGLLLDRRDRRSHR